MNFSAELVIIFLASLIFLFVLIYFGVGALLYNILLTSRVSRRQEKLAASDSYQEKLKNSNSFIYEGESWFREMTPAETVIMSDRNEQLHGYTIHAPQQSDRWVICLHGYTAAPYAMGPYGRKFHSAGFNTLYPALRGHDSSENKSISMGWLDRLDVIDWCRFIVRQNPGAQIVLFGVSMGASTAMMASGEELPAQVSCIVADCGFSSVWEIFAVQLKRYARLPAMPFLYPVYTIARLLGRLDLKEASCIRQVRKSRIPTLFIHGDEDELIPHGMMDELFDAAGCEKEKLLIRHAGHLESANTAPALYWSTIRSFINRKLPQSAGSISM